MDYYKSRLKNKGLNVLVPDDFRCTRINDVIFEELCYGEIKEGSSSNLFILRDGALLTPPPSAGILEGITRQVVMELAAEQGIAAIETLLFPSDLYTCQEAFITSSIREIVPVTRVDDITIGSGCPGEFTTRLLKSYRDRAGKSA
jgi:branched-chain amino acid aminotransferase